MRQKSGISQGFTSLKMFMFALTMRGAGLDRVRITTGSRVRNQLDKWLCSDHEHHWVYFPILRQSKELLSEPWRIVGMLSEHCHLNRQMAILGISEDPICHKCGGKEETSIHILCRWMALAQYVSFICVSGIV